MHMSIKKFIAAAVLVFAAASLVSCSSDADVVSHNISQDSDNFKIVRRIVFFNGITDNYLLTIEGKCSIVKDNDDKQLEVTCKVGEDQYKKHYLGVSDNVTYIVEQLENADVSKDNYKVVYKPSEILKDVEIR
jgi:gene 64 protein